MRTELHHLIKSEETGKEFILIPDVTDLLMHTSYPSPLTTIARHLFSSSFLSKRGVDCQEACDPYKLCTSFLSRWTRDHIHCHEPKLKIVVNTRGNSVQDHSSRMMFGLQTLFSSAGIAGACIMPRVALQKNSKLRNPTTRISTFPRP